MLIRDVYFTFIMRVVTNAIFELFSRAGIAMSPNNQEVHVYSKDAGDWQLTDVLDQHDLRVTGIDWAPKTNRIVTCAAVSKPP